ncbi:MAG: thiamine pyrophosphate-binding protein [Gammaproteobacteria bacterium]
MKYSDQIGEWLSELGYSHYFYVGGGNIMHLTESLSRYLTGVPVVHEVAAGIGAEYFNEIAKPGQRALALVTAGPGLTNLVTAVSGAWLESRELLVIGGQVKVSDLTVDGLRGRGIQEINGVELLSSTTKESVLLRSNVDATTFRDIVSQSWKPRKGPVFIEFPLNVQATSVEPEKMPEPIAPILPTASKKNVEDAVARYNTAKRPIILIGGGVSYSTAESLQENFAATHAPIMTTYNGADRVDGNLDNYLGRPNTWGQRSSNIIIQQADLIIAVGTRLGLQQTGFNWQEFGRDAHTLQIEIDPYELAKGHPNIDEGLQVDADDFIVRFFSAELSHHIEWLNYAKSIRSAIPRVEEINHTGNDYISPYDFILTLETLTKPEDLIIPCSSGSAFTLSMQLYKQRLGQRVLTNKSLAPMGYGLSGAIGACIAGENQRRTILIEGDGGFAQNMQEVGTAEINDLNLKIFIFHDQGHASIRMTQANYFDGKYLGCDRASGLGLPDWRKLFAAWNVPVVEVNQAFERNPDFLEKFEKPGLCAFIVCIDPKQTYFPKISSQITADGSMESNPIDRMSPEIDIDISLPHSIK